MDILVRVFLQTFAFIDHGNIPKNGLTGSWGRCLLILQETAKTLPQWFSAAAVCCPDSPF